MRMLRLAALFARTTTTRAATILPVIAFGVVTALLLIVLGGVKAFFGMHGEAAIGDQLLSVIALALLVVPLFTLGGSAARLSARRRDERLSSLSLLGAPSSTVSGLAVLESTAAALIGSVLGVAAYTASVPFVGLIRFQSAPLGGAIWLDPGWIVLVVLGVGLLASASAVIGLRGVVISPLGVRTRQSAPRPHWARILLGVLVVLVTIGAVSSVRLLGGVVVVALVLAIGFGATLGILNLIGPVVLARLARRQARRTGKAHRLLAARTILESPKSAWRQISGVALSSFVAVFAGCGVALVSAAGGARDDAATRMQLEDIRTGVILLLAITFLLVACSVGVNQAAAILDRGELYQSLDRLGMPVEALDASRTRAVMSPLRIVAIGSAAVAAVVILPVTGFVLIVAPLSVLTIAASLACGIGLVWIGLKATTPLLHRVIDETARSL